MNLKGLTGLRWIAAFYVFLFHINMRLHPGFPEFLKRILSQGFLGVTLFFVLSGFILSYTYYAKTQTTYGQFIYKRLARIYPAYLVGWALCLLLSFLLHYYPKHFFALVVLDLLAIQSYFPNLALAWYGSGAWSMSTEFFFYFLFPLVLPLLLRLSKRNLVYLLLFSVVLCIVPGILLDVLHLNIQFTKFYCFPPSRFPEFLAGMCTSLLVFKHRWKVNGYWPIVAILATCVYLCFAGYRFSIVAHNFIVVPTIILLLAAISNTNKPGFYSWIESKTMVYLGKISYGFYIMQLPILFFLDVQNERWQLASNRWGIAALVFVVNMAMAILLYHFVEHPAHQYLIRRLERRKAMKQQAVLVERVGAET